MNCIKINIYKKKRIKRCEFTPKTFRLNKNIPSCLNLASYLKMSHYSKNAYLIERKNNVLMAIAEVSCSLALIVLRMKKDQNGVFNTNCLSSNSASGGIQLPPLRRASTSGKIRLPPINYVSACGKIQLPPTNSLNIITGVALLGLKLGDLQYLIDELCTIASLLGELSVPTPYLISKVDAPTNSNSMPTNSNSVIRMSEPLIIIPNNSGIELPEFEDVTVSPI